MNGGDGLARQFWRNVRCNDGEPENLDVKRLAGRLHGFQILPAVLPQTEVELMSRNRLLDRVRLAIELIRIAVRMKSVRLE